jgi:hypothetical protein
VIYEKHAVKALRLHPTNSALLVLGTAGAEIKVLHAATGKVLKKHKLANPVTALEAVLSGSLLVAGESREALQNPSHSWRVHPGRRFWRVLDKPVPLEC